MNKGCNLTSQVDSLEPHLRETLWTLKASQPPSKMLIGVLQDEICVAVGV
jgi:hypothetical protein